MTGDSLAGLLFLLAALIAPLVIYFLYVSLLREPRPRMKHIKCAVLGSLLACAVVALVGAVSVGLQGGDFLEGALWGAMVFLGLFGIPAAVLGAVAGAFVSFLIQPKR